MASQRPSQWTALRCREPLFWEFLEVAGEDAAANKVRELCGVQSRSELDRDPEAQARWHEVRRAFIEYQAGH